MTTPQPDDPTARGAAADAGVETPPDGGPMVGAEERVRGSRLLAWSVVFAAVLVGLALYLLYAGRLSPLLG